MIVVGVDGRDLGKEALRFALHEASMRGTRVRAVHAYDAVRAVPFTGPGVVPAVDSTATRAAAEMLLRDTVEAVAGERADKVERVVEETPAGDAILRHARDAELIVVGTRAHGAIAEMFLGSVSHHIVRHATCPVVVVPPVRR